MTVLAPEGSHAASGRVKSYKAAVTSATADCSTVSYVGAHQASIRPMLDVLDRVFPLLDQERGFSTPSIVVIGDQSTGKTSVLEAISGIPLPRGQEIVTRCPLMLILRDGKELSIRLRYKRPGADAQDAAAWHEEQIGHEAGVDGAVRSATEVLAGANRGIVDEVIYLEVTRPGCADLTLIDLPGITRVPVGDQPHDIESQIKSLIREYIKGDSKVLLCVVPADQDFSTAEAFLLAREVDPEGKRTLGVVSKIDKAEPGIRAKLEGSGHNNLHLQLGFVGVRCRKPEELGEGVSEAEVRQKEQEFFDGHPELNKMDRSSLGLPALVSLLVEIQRRCIVTCMPILRDQVHSKVQSLEQQLAGMPDIMESEVQAFLTFQKRLSEVQGRFADLALRGVQQGVEDDGLVVAARALEKCEEYYEQVHADVAVDRFVSDEFRDRLRAMMRNSRGVGLSNFLSHPVFQLAFHQEVCSKLGGPAAELVACMREYVEGVLRTLVERSFESFGGVLTLLQDEVSDFLDAQEAKAREHVGQVVSQQEHVMALGPEYDDIMKRVEQAQVELRRAADTESWDETLNRVATECLGLFRVSLEQLVLSDNLEEVSLAKMQMSLAAYTRVVLARVCDNVALCTHTLLVGEKEMDSAHRVTHCCNASEEPSRAVHAVPFPAACAVPVGKLLAEKVAERVMDTSTQSSGGLLPYMHDTQLAAKKVRLQRSLDNLKAAWRELKAIPMAAS